MPQRIHILGASGSGTTTLGKALAAHLDYAFFDTDAFYWVATEPPFRKKREVPDRLKLLETELARAERWVLSGSLCGWGDSIRPRFELVVFLRTADGLRLPRLEARERERYGARRIAPGGDLHDQYAAFLAWASRYEAGGLDVRSLYLHQDWLQRLPPTCGLVRLDGALPVADLIMAVVAGSSSADASVTNP
jgi:adenylate kinase family enzyme